MRIKVTLSSNRGIVLPTGFNEYLQAFIYSNIQDRWLHDKGFENNKRKFKLFVFSSILEKARFDKRNSQFIFPERISFLISSPVDWILEKFASGIFKNGEQFLGQNRLNVESVSIIKQLKIEREKIIVKALTPIEVHSTFEHNSSKKTYYYAATDSDFENLVNLNMQKKWESFYKMPCIYNLKIKPYGFNKEKIVRFGTKNRYIIIKGWSGNFVLEAKKELLRFAIDAGLGSRNSQGFGMMEILDGK